MIQYVKNKHGKIGLFYAENDNGQLKVGYSLLNPRDIKEVKEYNWRVKQTNAESYRRMKVLGETDAPIESYKPYFDKEVAIRLAKERAQSVLDIESAPRKVRAKLWDFVWMANRHLGGKIKVSIAID